MVKTEHNSGGDRKPSRELLMVVGAHVFAIIEAASRLNAVNPEGTQETENQILGELLKHGAKQAKAATPYELAQVAQRALDARPLLEELP